MLEFLLFILVQLVFNQFLPVPIYFFERDEIIKFFMRKIIYVILFINGVYIAVVLA